MSKKPSRNVLHNLVFFFLPPRLQHDLANSWVVMWPSDDNSERCTSDFGDGS